MREIIFRGKRVDNGEWVYGSFVPDLLEALEGVDGLDGFIKPFGRTKEERLMVEVERDTVGQYTGLTDKNGKRTFEGDIVKYTFDSPDDPTATENGLKVRIGRIFWSEWRATFAVTGGKNGSAALNQDVAVYVRGRGIYQYVRGANTVEVIGNIHDNPELLK